MREPFLRPVSPEGAPPAPCPPDCRAEPAGVWDGQAMEVVYDPARHDVAFFRGPVSGKVQDGLRRTGWDHRANDGPNQMWTRDRDDLARRRLERTHAAPGAPRIA